MQMIFKINREDSLKEKNKLQFSFFVLSELEKYSENLILDEDGYPDHHGEPFMNARILKGIKANNFDPFA
jgi:hypothetical protein